MTNKKKEIDLNRIQQYQTQKKRNMQIQGYNPSIAKLYSKYARNQAKKTSQPILQSTSSSFPKKNPHNLHVHSSPQTISPQFLQLINKQNKPKKIISTFDMCQSRQQRQKKFNKFLTPSIGQYNIKIQNKIKFNWDILKIFHHRYQNKYQTNHQQHNYHSKSHCKTIDNNLNLLLQQSIHQLQTNPLAPPPKILRRSQTAKKLDRLLQSQNTISHQQHRHRTINYINPITQQQSKPFKLKCCQVNMSRMTGRPDQKHYYTQNSSNLQLNKSIGYIKNKTTQNVDFKKQISRQKAQSLKKPLIVPNDYTYNISIIKPKSSHVLQFGKTVGRQPPKKHSENQIYIYGYYHYNKLKKSLANKNRSLNLRKLSINNLNNLNNLNTQLQKNKTTALK